MFFSMKFPHLIYFLRLGKHLRLFTCVIFVSPICNSHFGLFLSQTTIYVFFLQFFNALLYYFSQKLLQIPFCGCYQNSFICMSNNVKNANSNNVSWQNFSFVRIASLLSLTKSSKKHFLVLRPYFYVFTKFIFYHHSEFCSYCKFCFILISFSHKSSLSLKYCDVTYH